MSCKSGRDRHYVPRDSPASTSPPQIGVSGTTTTSCGERYSTRAWGRPSTMKPLATQHVRQMISVERPDLRGLCRLISALHCRQRQDKDLRALSGPLFLCFAENSRNSREQRVISNVSTLLEKASSFEHTTTKHTIPRVLQQPCRPVRHCTAAAFRDTQRPSTLMHMCYRSWCVQLGPTKATHSTIEFAIHK